jgi:hypothetical protein
MVLNAGRAHMVLNAGDGVVQFRPPVTSPLTAPTGRSTTIIGDVAASPTSGLGETAELKHAFVEVAAGVRLHYVEAGSGPLVVLLHGFPEFWFSWRHQLPALANAGCSSTSPPGSNELLVGFLRGS